MTDWDPEPHEREWYREVVSGQRGWRVKRGGQDKIRLDYKEEVTKRLNPNEWVPDNEKRPMTPSQIAQICFEADKKLCFYLGMAENSRKSWLDLHEEKRRQWIETGPLTRSEERNRLNAAIRVALAPEVGDS